MWFKSLNKICLKATHHVLNIRENLKYAKLSRDCTLNWNFIIVNHPVILKSTQDCSKEINLVFQIP